MIYIVTDHTTRCKLMNEMLLRNIAPGIILVDDERVENHIYLQYAYQQGAISPTEYLSQAIEKDCQLTEFTGSSVQNVWILHVYTKKNVGFLSEFGDDRLFGDTTREENIKAITKAIAKNSTKTKQDLKVQRWIVEKYNAAGLYRENKTDQIRNRTKKERKRKLQV